MSVSSYILLVLCESNIVWVKYCMSQVLYESCVYYHRCHWARIGYLLWATAVVFSRDHGHGTAMVLAEIMLIHTFVICSICEQKFWFQRTLAHPRPWCIYRYWLVLVCVQCGVHVCYALESVVHTECYALESVVCNRECVLHSGVCFALVCTALAECGIALEYQ